MSGSKGSLALSGSWVCLMPVRAMQGTRLSVTVPGSDGAWVREGPACLRSGLSSWGRAVSTGAAGGAHRGRCCRPLPGPGDLLVAGQPCGSPDEGGSQPASRWHPEPRGSCGRAWPGSSLSHLPPMPFCARGTRLLAAGVVVSTTATQGVLTNAEAQLSPGLGWKQQKAPRGLHPLT